MNAKELKKDSEVKIKAIVDDYVKKTGLEIVGIQVGKDKCTGFTNNIEDRKVTMLLE